MLEHGSLRRMMDAKEQHDYQMGGRKREDLAGMKSILEASLKTTIPDL